MIRIVPAVVVLVLAAAAPSGTSAQTANASPTAGAGAAGGNVSRIAPSGGTAMPNAGQPQAGPLTPLDQHEEQKSKKAETICKGC